MIENKMKVDRDRMEEIIKNNRKKQLGTAEGPAGEENGNNSKQNSLKDKKDKAVMEEKTETKVSKKKDEDKGTNGGGIVAWAQSNRGKLIIGAVGLFTLFLFIQLKYIYDIWFDPDELDIYSVGFEMAKGKVLYRDIPSQHMPFTYIFSAFFYILGAHTPTLQRLYFYILFAGAWTYMVFAYKKYVNKWVIIFMPFVYHMYLQTMEFSTQILSEHLAVIGGQIFLLEFLVFMKKRDISIGSCVRMSFAVVMTFGAAFINIFPLFFLGAGVLALEIWWRVKDKTPRGEWWKMMVKRYLRLFAIVAVPWLLLVVYMLATHSFHDFGFCAYTINRLYYAPYMNGLGGGVFSTLVTPFTEISIFAHDFSTTGISLFYMIKIFTLGCIIYMAYKLCKRGNIIAGITVYMFVTGFGTRGFFNYHGATFVGVASLVTTYVMVTYMYKNKDSFLKTSMFRRGGLCVATVAIAVIYFSGTNMIMNFITGEALNSYATDTEIMETVLDEDERFWQTNTCDTVCIAALRVTDGPSVSTPWMWDSVGKKKMDDFIANPTKVVQFQIGYETWGHKMADYAPEAYYYIVNNYKFIPTSSQIWVRNDYYEEACRKLGIDPNMANDCGISKTPFTVDASEMPGMTEEDRKAAVKRMEEEAAAEEEKKNNKNQDNTTEENPEDKETEKDKKNNSDEDKEKTTEDSDKPVIENPDETSDGESSEGPAGVTVSPTDNKPIYLDADGNEITEDTPGAVQAPDGSWVLPDDSDGPGQ